MKSINLLKAKEVAAVYMILAAGERGPRVPLQELVKDLRELTLEMYSKMEEYEIETCLKELIGRLEGAWISIEDRLPEVGEIVMVTGGNWEGRPDVFTAKLEKERWVDYYGSNIEGSIMGCDITHWRPLPEPPESEVDVDE